MNDQSQMPRVPKQGLWDSFRNTALAIAEAIDGDTPEIEVLSRLRNLEERVSRLEKTN